MLPKSLTQSEHETPGGDGASFELSDFIMQNPASKQRTSTISNSKILSEEEINKVTKRGSPLHLACYCNKESLVQSLFDKKANPK